MGIITQVQEIKQVDPLTYDLILGLRTVLVRYLSSLLTHLYSFMHKAVVWRDGSCLEIFGPQGAAGLVA